MADSMFNVTITSELQMGIQELCALKGSTYISILVSEGRVYFAASVPEYIKILTTESQVDCGDICLRVPIKILKPINSVGVLTVETGENLILTKHLYSSMTARIKVPFELDFNSEFMLSIIREGARNDNEIDLRPIGQLRELTSIDDKGLQVKDSLAYIDGNGFTVFKTVPAITQSLLMSTACLSMLTGFISHARDMKLFTVGNFDIAKRGDMYFGWKRSRNFVTTSYEDYKRLHPLFSKSVSFTSARGIIKSIDIDKTKQYKCTINFNKDYIQVDAGTMGVFVVKFSAQFLLQPESGDDLIVTVPFRIFKNLVSVSSLDWESFQILVYPSCVGFQFGDTSVLIVRG